MKRWELSGYYHGTVGHISRCIAFDLCITKSNRIFMAICSRMDYFNDGPPSDRISGEEGKITEEVRFCDLDRGSYHRNHSGSLFLQSEVSHCRSSDLYRMHQISVMRS